MHGALIVRWTGRGRIENLNESVKAILKAEGRRGRVFRLGGSVIVEGVEPASVEGLLGRLPGVEWIAIGRSSNSLKGLAKEIGGLARTYARSGSRFAVRGESTDERVKPSDLVGAGTSAVLDAVSRSRVSEPSPQVVFRMAFDGGRGVAAVETSRGPGGSAIARETATCLVSGGKHSSVMAWTAMLSGYSVRLVHVEEGEESARAVARLYAELSHRVDPRRVELVVLRGKWSAGAFASKSRRFGAPLFNGTHRGCGGGTRRVIRGSHAPLFLLPEEWFDQIFSDLGIQQYQGDRKSVESQAGPPRVLRIGGVRSDAHGVMEVLKRSPPRS